jgi:hypothetical protein
MPSCPEARLEFKRRPERLQWPRERADPLRESLTPSLLEDRIGKARLDPVERLLVGLCRRDAGAAVDSADLAQLASNSFRKDWSELASRHRVAGLALLALQSHPGWSQISPDVAQDLLSPDACDAVEPSVRPRSFGSLLTAAHRKHAELERLLGLLRAERLEPVVLKGPALCRSVYRDAVERRYGDFDLLFPVAQVDGAIEVVSAAGYTFPFSPEKLTGYRQLHFHLLLRRPGPFRTEVHWGLSNASSPFQLDPEAFLRRAVATTCRQGTPMRIPCPEHLLLHLVHENLRDSFSRFGRIVDLDRILASAPGLDWDYTLAQARQGGLDSLMALSLELAHQLLAAPVPPGVLASLRPGAATRIHLRLMRPAPSLMRRQLREVGAASSLRFWLAAGARRRGQLLLRMLSGGQAAKNWIFQASTAGPPTRREALAAGLKSGFKLVGHHVTLYWNGLRERTDR